MPFVKFLLTVTVLVTLLGLVHWLFIAGTVPWHADEQVVDLVSLDAVTATNGDVKGTFVLGTGTVTGALGDNIVYYVREARPEGTLLRRYDATKVFLTEDDAGPRVIHRFETDLEHPDIDKPGGHVRAHKVILVVPPRTILRDVNAEVRP